jgi:hypothetical protein
VALAILVFPRNYLMQSIVRVGLARYEMSRKFEPVEKHLVPRFRIVLDEADLRGMRSEHAA